jgi:SAM-dependent methyltransferase
MPFRARFDCLWCGDAWTARGSADLEGWAQLCPTCLGRAGSNAFLRGRLRIALAERAAGLDAGAEMGAEAEDDERAEAEAEAEPLAEAAGRAGAVSEAEVVGRAEPSTEGRPATAATRVELSAPRAAPIIRRPARPAAALSDDWFLRRGPFERGPVHDTAWAAELDVVTRWLDAQPLRGRILEPAAGVGFFSPLLAERGELHATDVDGTALDIARGRLIAHRLRAHLHVAEPWAKPSADDPPYDALVASFLVGRVRGAGVDPATASLRARLRQGGCLAVIDLRADPAGGPPPGIAWSYHDPEVLEAALARAGFSGIGVSLTGRFFLTVAATAA